VQFDLVGTFVGLRQDRVGSARLVLKLANGGLGLGAVRNPVDVELVRPVEGRIRLGRRPLQTRTVPPCILGQPHALGVILLEVGAHIDRIS